MQSIEYALRSLDKLAEQEQERGARLEKTLADYQAQLDAALDLDKNETQIAPGAENDIGLAGDVLQAPSIPLRESSDFDEARRWDRAGGTQGCGNAVELRRSRLTPL